MTGNAGNRECSGGQQSQKIVVVFPDFPSAFAEFFDLTTGMKHCCVIASAEGISNFRETVIGQLLRKRHGYLPRSGNRSGSLLGMQIAHSDLIVIRRGFLNIFDADLSVLDSNQIT